MTTSDDAASAASDGGGRGLSRGMKVTLWAVGAAVVIGVIVVIALLNAPTGAPAGASATPSSSATTGPGPSPDATPADGSEVPSPEPSASATSGLPPRTPDEPLVTTPLPESATADGELVDGFPSDVMGPPDDTTIVSSSIASEADVMQVTLVARTDASQEDVLAHYRSLWSDLGLTDSPTESADLSYANEYSSLTLAFTPSSGTGTVFMVYGVLKAG